ncbi:HNH endonuclease [Pseudalkalibacillus sp. A8]|uniref:HNH endonuclease n=1 Tax=Pseudalkalibacillus sp. A8 TaxID=3382641 RepID=UPI0038B5B47B
MEIIENIITDIPVEKVPKGPALGKSKKGNYIRLPLQGKNGEGKVMKIDLKTYAKLGIHGKKVTLQARRYPALTIDGKLNYIHRLSLGLTKSIYMVDHISGDTLDNRKHNLRRSTNQQNQWNSKIRKDNKTGYKGAFWSKREKRYIAKIRLGDKHSKYLGSYLLPEEAALAYNFASVLVHGSFGRINEKLNLEEISNERRAEIEKKVFIKVKKFI